MTDTEKERKRGRPIGSKNKTGRKNTAGSLSLSAEQIIDNLKESIADGNTIEAVLKEATTHPGTNGKATSGLIYCPAEWADGSVLALRLSATAAARLKAADLTAQAEALQKQASNKK